MRIRAALRHLGLGIVLAAAAGCVAQDRPAGCDEASVAIELELRGDELVSGDPTACRDQEVSLTVTADAEGTFHIHGYDHAVSAAEYGPDAPLELQFIADRTGQFAIELHTDEDPQGTAIGVFTVHEP